MLSKAPLYLDNNTTLNKGQKETLNSLFVSRWNWLRTKVKQPTRRDAVVSSSSTSNTARVFGLYCLEYYYVGIASFTLYTLGLKAGKEYRLFSSSYTPEDVAYNGVIGVYNSEDISKKCEIYFKDKVCYIKPSEDLGDAYALVTIKWRYSDDN